MTLVNVDGQQVIAVVVTESTQTPHFTGKAYVRVGDSAIEVSEEKFRGRQTKGEQRSWCPDQRSSPVCG